MKRKACLAWLGIIAASCGGRAASDNGSPSSGTSGGVGNSGGQSSSIGGELPVGGSGNGVSGTTATSHGGSSPIGAQGGVSGTASDSDAGIVIPSDAGTSCEDLGVSCLSKPSDASCASDADCVATPILSCGTTPIIGLNRQGKSVCVAPACVPPPPGGPPSYYEVQDCTQLSDVRQASVHCVNQTCLTYYAGCKDCLY